MTKKEEGERDSPQPALPSANPLALASVTLRFRSEPEGSLVGCTELKRVGEH